MSVRQSGEIKSDRFQSDETFHCSNSNYSRYTKGEYDCKILLKFVSGFRNLIKGSLFVYLKTRDSGSIVVYYSKRTVYIIPTCTSLTCRKVL